MAEPTFARKRSKSQLSDYEYKENTIITVQFQDRKTMDIVEEDLEYLFWDKEGTSLVKNAKNKLTQKSE